MSKKSVLIVASVYSHISQFHQNLIDLLAQNNYIVDIVGNDNLNEKPGRTISNIRTAYDITIHRNPINIKNLKAYKELKAIISRNQYDYIHANTPIGGFLTRLINLKKMDKKPKIIYTAHGFHFYKGAPLKNWILYYSIEKILSRKTDILVTINKEDYETSIKKKFLCKVVHIHGVGVDSNKFTPISSGEINNRKIELGFKEETKIGLCIGELNDNKNQEILIKATSLVIKENPNFILLLAGNGPNKENLEQLTDELSLNDHIKFLGYLSSIEKYVQISDFVISASKREGLGLNIIEGMLCKKIIIASMNRGHNELITNGKNGFLVKNEFNQFANVINKVFEISQSKKDIILNEAYRNALDYSWNYVKNEIAKIYEIKVVENE